MARKNLQRLLNKIEKESSLKKEVRRLINKRVHYYDLDLNDLVSEISEEIKGTFAKADVARLTLKDDQIEIIKAASKKYFNRMRASMGVPTATFNVEVLEDSSSYFRVRIESIKGNADVFESFINRNRKQPLTLLRNTLSRLLPDKIDDNTIKPRLDILLQTGHKVGSSIAEQRVKNYLSSIDTVIKSTRNKLPAGISYENSPVYSLEAKVAASDRLNSVRQTITVRDIYVTEQGRESNRSQGIEEKKILDSIRGKIKKALKEEDWINFETSSSPYDRVHAKIMATARKSKAKVTPKAITLPSNSSVKSKGTQGRVQNSSSTDNVDVSGKIVRTQPKTANKQVDSIQNWNKLLPIINSKLPPRVIANMKFPSLINRTGTFANSAEIVRIETTKEGYPSFVYNYERDPYNVFDRTVGRFPWNTPERDPSALVDKSVREIIREMAIGRFYTRRA